MSDSILSNVTDFDNERDPGRAFVQAFCPETLPPHFPRSLTLAWIEQATVGIDALITFRSALHRWLAAGCIPDAEFVQEAERLDLANLDGWFEHLLALALAAAAIQTHQEASHANHR